MVVKGMTYEKRSASELALIAIFRKENQETEHESKTEELKRTVRGVAEPKAHGDALRVAITQKPKNIESSMNGQMNILLVSDESPVMIGGRVLFQVGVTSLNEQAVKEALDI